MQRWIVLGVLVLGLLGAGSRFGYREYLRNKHAPVWVPMPINAELTLEKRTEICDELKERLLDEDLLMKVVKDTGAAAKWELASDEAAVVEISKRLFVRSGSMKSATGSVPAIHVGLNGKGREREVLGAVATRLMKDVFKILGIEESKREGMDPPPI
jgi:hypothetical protein